ncbi:MAG: sulfatase-like hydrolase/transferase [Eubacterium sp.]|nr:sulfatase-like hydrolase/transferase [Eubacterium sp.]
MNDIIFIISKDCLSKEALPVYGNKYWKTPNIDALAKKGCVFSNYYAAGGSTWMAISSMMSGKYPYEFKSRKTYEQVVPNEHKSLFDIFQEKGYETHIIWDIEWEDESEKYCSVFGDRSKTVSRSPVISQNCGSHANISDEHNKRDDEKAAQTMEEIKAAVDSIDFSKKQFVYMHLPHVLLVRRCYMDDMDLFDEVVGYIREKVSDESIYLTTDHGHMNLHKGITGYGFDVYEPVINIPLITPRINGCETYDGLISAVDFCEILLNGTLPDREYVLCDTAYYAQPQRKLAVVGKRYKYIFNREDSSEELYDILWDKEENYNILRESYYEKNRGSNVFVDELYFYPYKNEALKEYEKLKKIKNDIWVEPSSFENFYYRFRRKV